MKFEIYCDESNPDLFTSNKKERAKYLLIGSLWLPAKIRQQIKDDIKEIRKINNTWGEIKWKKVSESRIAFYTDLIDLFIKYNDDLRFRCIAVEADKIKLRFHQNDAELGFYKYYYQVIHHWILDFNKYSIFCDIKTNRELNRLSVLKRCLNCSNLTSRIDNIQALPSKEVVLLQLCDFLLGIASSRLNNSINQNTPKEIIIKYLEEKLKVSKLKPTLKSEQKFNIFKIMLQGGW